MYRKPRFIIPFIIICLMAIGAGSTLRKLVNPVSGDTPVSSDNSDSIFSGLGDFAKSLITARLGYSSPDPDDAKQVRRGSRIYAEHCAACHGANIEGQADWRKRNPDGTLPAPPHDANGHTWHHPDQLLFDYTQKGGQALAPKGFTSAMPKFDGVLSNSDTWSVLAYIKSHWPEDARKRQESMNPK